MKRFSMFDEIGSELYTRSDIAAMSDKELADAIRAGEEWDAHLLEELIWRAFPDYDGAWEVGDWTCFDAAKVLGVEIM